MQFKSKMEKDVSVSVKSIERAEKILGGILAHVFGSVVSI